MDASIVVTVRNEARNIEGLLDSLVRQTGDKEIVVVDAFSSDGTAEIAGKYAAAYPYIKLYRWPGKRGEGRNYGVSKSSGDYVVFIDGDCIASEHWLSEIISSLRVSDVVAGRTVYIGRAAYLGFERVELYRKGMDVTYPSCNLAYRRKVFTELGGFDRWFITAEDIDLNIRAVDSGHAINYNDLAVVRSRTRDNIYGFSRQAFWNGAGRKQLTLKHGSLWKNYRPLDMFRRKMSFHGLLRVSMALLGYLGYKLFGEKRTASTKKN
ncbi:MAG: glycosyltransferase [Thermoplasmata archaeon]|nr:glycosyltransferase [Candidatus Sysuiplasma jiujiangense]